MRFSGVKNRKYTVRSDIAATASCRSGSSEGSMGRTWTFVPSFSSSVRGANPATATVRPHP